MTRAFESRLSRCVLTMTLALAACGSPAPAPPNVSGPSPAPIVTPPIQTVDAAPSASPSPSRLRLAARDPALDDWKRVAAERVYAVNRTHLFEGRPEHLLRAAYLTALRTDASVVNYLARRLVEANGAIPAFQTAAPGGK